MSDILFEDKKMADAFYGDKKVAAIYFGDKKVWPLDEPVANDYKLLMPITGNGECVLFVWTADTEEIKSAAIYSTEGTTFNQRFQVYEITDSDLVCIANKKPTDVEKQITEETISVNGTPTAVKHYRVNLNEAVVVEVGKKYAIMLGEIYNTPWVLYGSTSKTGTYYIVQGWVLNNGQTISKYNVTEKNDSLPKAEINGVQI